MNTTTEIYNKSLPLLAAALSDQRGIKVEIGGDKAWTNGKTIHVPSLPLDADDTLLDVARGYVDHESAHVLFSEFARLKNARLSPLEKHLANSIEDIRIEKRMADRYPGCAQNFKSTALHVFAKYSHKNNEPAFVVPNYVLLRLRSQTCPELFGIAKKAGDVVARNFPGLVTELENVFADIRTCCPDTRASIAFGKRIAALLKNYEQQKAEQPGEGPDGAANGQDNTDSENEPTTSAGSSSNQEENPAVSGSRQNAPADASSPMQPASLAPLFAADADKKLPKGMGELLSEELGKNISKSSDNSIGTAVEVPPTGFKPMPQDMLDRTLCLQASLRPLLRGTLQADTLEGTMPSVQGRLNDRKLYSVPLGNQHIFSRRIPARLTSTALHILVDRSGSTANIIKDVAISSFAVAHAASGIRGVSVGMSVFPVDHPEEYVTGQPGISTLIRHGQTSPRYQDFGASGMTPLAESVWHVLPALVQQRTSRRILLIFTDGCPDSIQKTGAALHDAAKLGVEVYGVSFQNDSILRLLGEQHAAVIDRIEQLHYVLSTMLLTALCKAA